MGAVTLSKALKVGSKTFKSVTMRESTMGDEEDAQAMAVDLGRPGVMLTTEMCLLSILTSVPYDDLRAMPPYDYELLRAEYNMINRPTQPGPTAPQPEQGPAPGAEEPAPEPA